MIGCRERTVNRSNRQRNFPSLLTDASQGCNEVIWDKDCDGLHLAVGVEMTVGCTEILEKTVPLSQIWGTFRDSQG